MPSGGVLSSGSGLQLQATTPGVEDRGNANVNGVILADRLGTHADLRLVASDGDAYRTTVVSGNGFDLPSGTGLSGVYSFGGVFIGYGKIRNPEAQFGNFQSPSILVGTSCDIFCGGAVLIGDDSQAGLNDYGVGCTNAATIVIGSYSTAWGTAVALPGRHPVVLGCYNNVLNANSSIVIGNNNSLGTNDKSIQSNSNIWIGNGITRKANFAVNNSIIIASNSNMNIFDQYDNPSNQIIIGNKNHTVVRMGKLSFTGTNTDVIFRQTADKAVTGTAETSLLGTGAGTTTLDGLKAGSQIGLEGWADVAWPNAGTVTLRLKLGATTILQTAAIPITAGSNFGSHIRAEISVRAGGAGGSVVAAISLDSGGITNRVQVLSAPVAVDLSSAVALDLTAEISNAGDSITSRLACVEVAK